jgi:hypothetical protein
MPGVAPEDLSPGAVQRPEESWKKVIATISKIAEAGEKSNLIEVAFGRQP